MAFTQEFYADAQGGITNGTPITNANNGTANGNSNFSRVDIGAGNTVIATNSWANKSGTLAYQMTQAGANRPGVYGIHGGARTNPSASWEESISTSPAVAGAAYRMFSDAGYVTAAIDFQITASRKLLIRDVIGATGSASSTGILTAGSPYTFIVEYNDASKIATFVAYQQGTTTVQATISYTLAANVTIQSWEFGIIVNSANYTRDFDRLNVGYGGTATRFDISNVAPVATRTGSEFRAVNAGDSLSNLGWVIADSDGTVASASAAVTSRPAGSGLPSVTGSPTGIGTGSANFTGTCTFAAVGRYVVTLTATDNIGAVATGQTTYTVDVAPSLTVPTDIRTFNDLNWNQFGAQANLVTALADGDVATGVESPASPSVELMEIQSGALRTNGITWRINARINGAGTGTMRIRCYKSDKTTLLQTFNITLTNVDTWYSGQLNSTALGLIPLATDRVGLWWIADGTVV